MFTQFRIPALLLILLCAACATVGDICPLRETGYVTPSGDARSLTLVLGDALEPFGFVYVENTHSTNKWFTLGANWSRERVDVFFNASTGWISLKDYNYGVASDLDKQLLAAIKEQVRKNYHEQIQFRRQHDCLG